MIFCCERPQHARLADARAAADDYHARALLEQFSQVPPVGAVAAVEHEDVDVPARQQPRHRPAPQAAAPAVDAHYRRVARDALRELAEAALLAQLREAEPHRLVAALLGVALAHVGALRVVEERRRVGPRDGVPRELRRRPHVDAARAAINTTPQELGRAHDARWFGLRHCGRERGERLRPGREGAAVQRALDVVGGNFGCSFLRVSSFLERCHCVLRAMRAATAFFLAVLAVGSAAAVALLVSRAANTDQQRMRATSNLCSASSHTPKVAFFPQPANWKTRFFLGSSSRVRLRIAHFKTNSCHRGLRCFARMPRPTPTASTASAVACEPVNGFLNSMKDSTSVTTLRADVARTPATPESPRMTFR